MHFWPLGRRNPSRRIARHLTYITGLDLVDPATEETCTYPRSDVEFAQIILPDPAPERFYDLQYLLNQIEGAEKRPDARTGRRIFIALPNELPLVENIKLLKAFINQDVLSHGLGAIAAIHRGENKEHPERSNPHGHIIVTTRSIGQDGFCRTKARDCDRKEYLLRCRADFARIQNEAYARNGIDKAVDARSFRDQGLDREPTRRLSRRDYELEKRGERTRAGDLNREIDERNAERDRLQEQELSH